MKRILFIAVFAFAGCAGSKQDKKTNTIDSVQQLSHNGTSSSDSKNGIINLVNSINTPEDDSKFTQDISIQNQKTTEHNSDHGISISGQLVNNSHTSTYKDISIEVKFYSTAKKLLDTKYYVLPKYFTPGSNMEFKLNGGEHENLGFALVSVNKAELLTK